MTGKTRKVGDLSAEWMGDPAFRAEYAALEETFAIAEALIETRAGLTHSPVESRWKIKQSGAGVEAHDVRFQDQPVLAQFGAGSGIEAVPLDGQSCHFAPLRTTIDTPLFRQISFDPASTTSPPPAITQSDDDTSLHIFDVDSSSSIIFA